MKICILAFTLITAFIMYNLNNSYQPFNEFVPVSNDCKKITAGVGIEAIEDLIHYGRFLIGTSDDRMKLLMLGEYGINKTEDGSLVLFEKTTSAIKKLEIENFPKGVGFHPHGIYLFKNKTVYVINHAYNRGGERVEVLDLYWDESTDKIRGVHVKSIPFSEEFAGIFNDLAVVGENEFYISTFLPFKDDNQIGRNPGKIRTYLSYLFIALNLKFTYIYHCKESNLIQVPGTKSLENNGMFYDGINTLYAVNVNERRIRVYTINRNDMTNLEHVRDINLQYAIDNMDYDPVTGEINVAVIGKLYEQYNFIQEILRTKKHAQLNYWSGALKIETRNNDKVTILNMQKDYMYGVSSVVREGDKIFMGSWIDTGILVCTLDKSLGL